MAAKKSRHDTRAAILRSSLIAAVVVAFSAAILSPRYDGDSGLPAYGECKADSDCSIGGCSGQVCTSASVASGIVTTCEWREEYACFRMTTCGCVAGQCAWKNNTEFSRCLDTVR